MRAVTRQHFCHTHATRRAQQTSFQHAYLAVMSGVHADAQHHKSMNDLTDTAQIVDILCKHHAVQAIKQLSLQHAPSQLTQAQLQAPDQARRRAPARARPATYGPGRPRSPALAVILVGTCSGAAHIAASFYLKSLAKARHRLFYNLICFQARTA